MKGHHEGQGSIHWSNNEKTVTDELCTFEKECRPDKNTVIARLGDEVMWYMS